MENDASLILPSELPWKDLRSEALEELLFWLCDALGAKDLEWRAGSATGTSRDGGRDLDAVFHLPAPDGELVPERWWIQAKGRTRTVEPGAVKQALLDAQTAPEVDVLVIATNSRFSNDTRDLVRRSGAAHPRPRVRLWDRSQLERMLAKHPSVVARVAPEALSDAGRLRALTERFWHRLDFASQRSLERLWSERTSLELDHRSALALLSSEAANGDFAARPWGLDFSDDLLTDVLILGFANMPALLVRTEPYGGSWDHPMDALAYAVACGLLRFEASSIVGALEDPWRFLDLAEDERRAQERRQVGEHIRNGVLSGLVELLAQPCLSDCVRITTNLDDFPEDLSAQWDRFVPGGAAEEEKDDRMLVIQGLKKPCRAGLALSPEHGCPFFARDRDWRERVAEYQTVLVNRVAQRAKQRGLRAE